jgi:small-conductance mechanosensitive channel
MHQDLRKMVRHKNGWVRCAFIIRVTLIVCGMAFCALGQGSLPAPENVAAPTPADVRRDLRERIGALEERIHAAETPATQERADELGLSLSAMQDLALTLRQLRSLYEDHLNALDDLDEVRRAKEDLRKEKAGYQGLPDPPPYTPWYVDTLRDAVDKQQHQIDMDGLELERARERQARAKDGLTRADAALSKQREDVAKNTDAAAPPQLNWLLDTSLAARELAQATVPFAELEVLLAEERSTLTEAQTDFLKRKRDEAVAKERYGPADLDQRHDAYAKKREELQKDLRKAHSTKDASQQRLESARKAVDAAQTGGDRAAAQEAVDLRKTELVAANDTVEVLREQTDLLYIEEELWNTRYAIHTNREGLSIHDEEKRVREYVERFDSARQSQENRIASVRGAIRDLTRRLDDWQAGYGDRAVAGQKLRVLQGQLDLYAPATEALASVAQLSKHVLADVNAAEQRMTLGERIHTFHEQARSIWDYPLSSVEGSPLTVGKVFLALLILVLGYIVTRYLTRQLRRVLHARKEVDATAAATILRLVHYALLVFFLLFALYTVNIPLTVFTLFGGALAIGVGFGAQNLINNFISGLILMFERPIRIGDVVEIDGKAGQVEEIGARSSRLRLFSGVNVLVPNSAFLEHNVVNWTLSDRKRRFAVTVGVAYGSPTRDVAKLILKAVEEHGKILNDPPPVVVFKDFGDNALVFEVTFWLILADAMDPRVVCSDVRHRIDRLFREAGISIAFPQRDVHLDAMKPIEVRVLPPRTPGEETGGPA